MPILPENKHRYPKDWKVISRRIRFERAGGRCEFIIDGNRCPALHGLRHPFTGSMVVLTVAHLDHTPENCDDANLLAGCQLCHNRYDREHRNETRKARIVKPMELFEVTA
jgi:hypothetical protein